MNPTTENADTLDRLPQNGSPSFEPPPTNPRTSVGDAMRWHWLTVLISVVLLTGVAVAVGLLRQPHFTAQTTLTVNQASAGAGGLVGFADASGALASGYSRAITATDVTTPVAQKAGLPAATVASDISASPVPQSPVIQVHATADSGPLAIRLANLAGKSLVAYVGRINRSSGASTGLLNQYATASARSTNLNNRLSSLRYSGADAATIRKARKQRDAAKLEQQALGTTYQQAKEGETIAKPLQVLSPTSTANSDRSSKLELLVMVGLVGGSPRGAHSRRGGRTAEPTELQCRTRRAKETDCSRSSRRREWPRSRWPERPR